jgi:hypothetical protein
MRATSVARATKAARSGTCGNRIYMALCPGGLRMITLSRASGRDGACEARLMRAQECYSLPPVAPAAPSASCASPRAREGGSSPLYLRLGHGGPLSSS